jgi:hypothetical protein
LSGAQHAAHKSNGHQQCAGKPSRILASHVKTAVLSSYQTLHACRAEKRVAHSRKPIMRILNVRDAVATSILAAGLLTLSLVAAPTAIAQKAAGACVNKAGEGTNTTVDGAKFQAWEAVLQATDWGIWSAMMASKQEVGNAPGMKVSNLKSSCKPGGLGQTCIVSATLCR